MVERNAQTLADAYVPELQKAKRGRANLKCASDDEAKALARELKSRGWKAKADVAVSLKTGETFPYVAVTGPGQKKGGG